MHRDRRDAGTLAYIIVHKRAEGLPLLSKAMPSTSEMDAWSESRGLNLDSDVALYLTVRTASEVWESLAEDVRARTEVRAVIVYYTATVAASEGDMTLLERHKIIKNQVARLVYTRNKLSTEIEKKELKLREIREQIPHAEADDNAEVLQALKELEVATNAELELRRPQMEEASALAEEAKEGLLAIQRMMKVDVDHDELHAARAAAHEAMRHIRAVLDTDPS